jgi:tetratricopeptide (TPR) repeat protein
LQAEIEAAARAEDRSTHVFLITGQGGDGKTVLLRQVGMGFGSPDGIQAAGPWSGIIDLYHSDLNSNSGLELYLAEVYGKEGEFDRFLDERAEYDRIRKSGVPAGDLETARAGLGDYFAEGMNTFASWSRPVVALDTAERIQYEQDDVQTLCGLDEESTTVRAWLFEQLARWRNCVVLIAGRPQTEGLLARLIQRNSARWAHVKVHNAALGGFDDEEADAYFAKWRATLEARDRLTPEFFTRLRTVTRGNPVRLELAYEIAGHGFGLEELRAAVMSGEAGAVQETLDRLLIRKFMEFEAPDMLRVMRYLSLARKGLTAPLLAYLEDGDAAHAAQELEAIAHVSFIKHRERDDSYYFHDELFDLCDREMWETPQAQRTSRRIAAWYDEQLAAGIKDERAADLLVDSLFYRLRASPEEGYAWFLQRDDDAIRSAGPGLDLRLHNELMAFLRSASKIDCELLGAHPSLGEQVFADAAAAWVKRFGVRGKNREAIERIANTVQAYRLGHPELASKNPLGWAEFDVYRAQAHMYAGKPHEAVAILKQVISNQGEEQPSGRMAGWRANLVRGRAHNNLGYVYWNPLGRLEAALREFALARDYFAASNLQEELANTLDNMSRVYATLRHQTRAEALVETGMAIRLQEGREYRTALSQNSLAIVHLEFGRPHRAQRLAKQAQVTCDRLNVKRGIGLTSITLGHALRSLGKIDEIHSFAESEECFSESLRELRRAAELFEKEVYEPVRLVEALNQLGSTYRDWARLTRRQPDAGPQKVAGLLDGAVRNFKRSIEEAEKYGFKAQAADACEDLAETLLMQERRQEAEQWLERGAQQIPDEYKLARGAVNVGRPAQKRAQIPLHERVESYWLMLGKIELTRGTIVYEREPKPAPVTPERRAWLQEMVEHFVLAAYYFESFSDEATRLKDTFRRMYEAFTGSSVEERRWIGDVVLQDAAEQYGIEIDRLDRFYADTLGMALEGIA